MITTVFITLKQFISNNFICEFIDNFMLIDYIIELTIKLQKECKCTQSKLGKIEN